MKKMMIMAALIAVAISANAQNRYYNGGNYNAPTPYGNYGGNTYGNPNYHHDGYNDAALDQVFGETRMRLENGIRTGLITRNEARSLNDQFQFIQAKKMRFQRNGFIDRGEQREIMSDLAELNHRIEHEKIDGDRYGTNYGRGWLNGRDGFRNRF